MRRETRLTHIPPGLTCYTIQDVATLLNCTYKHVWSLVKAGHLQAIRLSPSSKRNTLRIPVTELQGLVAKSTMKRLLA